MAGVGMEQLSLYNTGTVNQFGLVYSMKKNTPEDIRNKFEVDQKTGCHLWTGTKDRDGYPLVKWQGKTHRALRLLWALDRGPVPDGLQMLHSCDRPSCVNPEHISVGTNKENRADCVAKGRQATGESVTRNRNTARGTQHWSKTKPERIPRGQSHHRFGRPYLRQRGADGRFIAGGNIA